ncbi:hypothetical protein, partial [Haemophilus influenzae]|uniref:hypothetical protein n=1 Tax=Haemophilus influenzae TaxID=727 RepID=UPI001C6132EB
MRLKISENFDRTSAIYCFVIFSLRSPCLRGELPQAEGGISPFRPSGTFPRKQGKARMKLLFV